MPIPPKHLKDLFRLVTAVDTQEEAQALLEDILTPQELASLAERWQLVQELAKGTPQREVAKKLGVSVSKVTRGSRMLQFGSGGFVHFLKKIQRG